MDSVNRWISDNYNRDIAMSMRDSNFKEYYSKIVPVIINRDKLVEVLKNNNVTSRQITNIINDYFFNLVPDHIKIDAREKHFNNIIKNKVESELTNYSFYFGKTGCDWYVINKETGDKLTGYSYPQLFYDDQTSLGMQKLKKNILRDEKVLNVLINFKKFANDDYNIIPTIQDGIQKGNLCYIENVIDCIRRII